MKVLSAETNLSSATNVGSASVVRIFNSDSSAATVTKKDSGGSTIGSFTISAGEVVYSEKDYTDTLEGGATLKVSKVAYSHMMSYSSYTSSGGGGGGYTPPKLPDLVVYLNPASYSGSGTSWPDSSGNSNDYTLVNGVSYQTSPKRFNFDGTNDFARPTSSYTVNSNTVTFIAWIKRNGTQNSYAEIMFARNVGVNNANGFNFYGTSHNLGYHWNNSNWGYNSGLTIADATWTMVALAVSGSAAKFYRYTSSSAPAAAQNNTSHGAQPFTGTTAGALGIGNDCEVVDQRGFNGDIGHALFYSTTLSESDITDIYDNTKSTYGY